MKKIALAVLAAAFAATMSLSAFAGDDNTIIIAATPTPHGEILEQVKPILEEQGYTLDIQIFEDYIIPNNVVESGEMDANYFQHVLYLNDFNAQNGTHLVNAAGIHYEPFGVYGGQKKSLDELADGDKIAVPNDPTNEARALLLLEENGVLTLKEGVGLEATKLDVESYAKDIELVEVEAAQVPHLLGEVSYAVMNGNYALEAGFSASKDAIALESADSDAISQYVNVIAVKEGNENSEKIQALIAALTSDEIREYIDSTYDGSVVAYAPAEEGVTEEVTEAITE